MGLFSKSISDLELSLQVGDGMYCYISHEFSSNVRTTGMASIILMESVGKFLNRYKLISQDKQSIPVLEIISDFAESERQDFTRLMSQIESTIYETMDDKEKKRLASYATNGGAIPGFLVDKPLQNVQTTYKYKLKPKGNIWVDELKPNVLLGDKVILARLPVLLWQYVDSTLTEKEKTTLYNKVYMSVM